MKICYVDETGTHDESHVVIFVGLIADVTRVHKTRAELEELFEKATGLPEREITEVKGSNLYYGKGRWDGVDGELRHDVIHQLCEWLPDRKHDLAMAAVDRKAYPKSDLADITGLDTWMCGALHIALQVQKAHQSIEKNKGATFLVFDENKVKGDALADLLFDPPSWSDDYYRREEGEPALDQITDTAFYARSHHVGLVQVADIFAFVFRRYCEIVDYDEDQGYEGELERLEGWVSILSARLLDRSHRFARKSSSDLAKAYTGLAPPTIGGLG